jgi:hypothetical protein
VAQPRSPFSYAVVRVVPDIEREEFLNAGLVLFSRPHAYLAARTELDTEALAALRPGCDVDGIRTQLTFIEDLAEGRVTSGPFGAMTQSERFHWLTTPRSTLVQPGPLHVGTTDDPAATFEHVYGIMVNR